MLDHCGRGENGRHEGGVVVAGGGRRRTVRVLQLGGDDLGTVALEAAKNEMNESGLRIALGRCSALVVVM